MKRFCSAILLIVMMVAIPNTHAQGQILEDLAKVANGVLRIGIVLNHQQIGLAHITPPVSVTFRRSLLGRGLVMKITNTSIVPIYDFTVAASNASANQRPPSRIVARSLESGATVSVGWAEVGWRFEPGEQVGAKNCAKDYAGKVTSPR